MGVNNTRLVKYSHKEDDVFYFLHIPKTAGTSFISNLENFFDYNRICQDSVWPQLLKRKPNELQNYSLFRGHFGYGLHNFLEKKLLYLTMLRNPIKRTISNFEHIRIFSKGTNWVDDNFVSKNENIIDVLNDDKRFPIFRNEQTRELGLDLTELISSENGLKKLGTENKFQEILSTYNQPHDNNLLTIAKKSLESFAFFGILEKFEESLLLLFYTFGWRPNLMKWKMNVMPENKKKQISDKEIELIKNVNDLDLKLYQFADEIFQYRFSKMIDDLKTNYYEGGFDKFSSNELLHFLLEKRYIEQIQKLDPKPKNIIDFDFGKKIAGSCWCYREFSPNGQPFRWIEGKKADIDFILKIDDDLLIQFRIIAEIPTNNLKAVLVNNKKIELKKLDKNDNQLWYEGIISKENLQINSNFIRITFQANHSHTVQESQVPLPQSRNVSLAIDRIIIKPISQIHKNFRR